MRDVAEAVKRGQERILRRERDVARRESPALARREVMRSRATLLGHAIHPMLIVFPIGLLTTAVIFDVIQIFTDNPRWGDASFWMISAGLIGGLASALFGVIDWMGIPRATRAKRIGLFHGFGNAFVLLLFGMSWFSRLLAPSTPTPMAVGLGVVGVIAMMVTGWLGGELIARLGVSVDEGAHVNAPSSLSGKPASAVDAATIRQRS
jgi:uncharacterized membrane protein